MRKYVIKAYQPGFERDQARIGQEVARNWIWPYAYDLDDLLKIHAQPGFDPETRHYCFHRDEMVGFMVSIVTPSGDGDVPGATLDFPRMLPGHEGAAELLIEKALETLQNKGVSRVAGRVTTMCPADIRLAEKMGFVISDWGYKLYYSYEMGWGNLDIPAESIGEIDPGVDLEECARIASLWYKRSAEWCLSRLQELHAAGVITHLGLRSQGKLVAACLTAPNPLRPSTAANYYIYTPDQHSLKPILAKVVTKCIDFGTHNIIADLINEHRQYEPVYRELGFKKAAEWARCEKVLA